METHLEVDRLRDVYRGYAARGLGRSKWSADNPGNQAIQRERSFKTHELLERAGFLPLESRRILDVGCGTGEILAGFEPWGARWENLFGIDVIPERVRTARRNFPRMTCQLANAESLPFPDGSFDLIAVFTVFTSILDRQMAANVAREITRTLRSGGGVIWYDFRLNNPFNQHVRGMSRKRIQGLFPDFQMSLETISLLPPLARRLGSFTSLLYPRLRAFPFLRTHYLGLLTKPDDSSGNRRSSVSKIRRANAAGDA
jgi:SAM-dependent methyltransferase